MDEYMIDDKRTTMPWLMLSLKSDIMDCKIARCRFAFSKDENLERNRHKHVVYEMHYIIEGEINYDFPGMGSYSAKKGQFTLVPQGRVHSTRDADPGRTQYLVVAFSIVSDNGAVNTIFSPEREPMVLDFTSEMEALIAALYIKYQGTEFFTSHATKLIIHSILLEAVDKMAEHLGLDYFTESSFLPVDHRVNSIVRIVNGNIYSQKLKGEEVAAQLGITTRQLNRICNQYLGCSINQYIIQCRIKGMQAMLRESTYSLSEIADIFAFPDVYAFIKHFTRFTSMSPGNYRHNFGKIDVQSSEP